MRKSLTIAFIFMGLLTGVFWWHQQQPHYTVKFQEKTWQASYLPAFQFQIKAIEASYSFLITMDIDSAIYPFQNLWITYYLEDEKGNMLDSRSVNYDLFDKKTGKPQTSGILPKHRILIEPPSKDKNTAAGFRFLKSGSYKIKLAQFMRKEALPGVISTTFSLIQRKVK